MLSRINESIMQCRPTKRVEMCYELTLLSCGNVRSVRRVLGLFVYVFLSFSFLLPNLNCHRRVCCSHV